MLTIYNSRYSEFTAEGNSYFRHIKRINIFEIKSFLIKIIIFLQQLQSLMLEKFGFDYSHDRDINSRVCKFALLVNRAEFIHRCYSGTVTCSYCKKNESKDAAIGEKAHRIGYDELEGQKRWRTTREEGKSELEGEGLLNSWRVRKEKRGRGFKGAERERERKRDGQNGERRKQEEEEEISLGALTTRVQYSHPYRAESSTPLPRLRARHTFPASNVRTPTCYTTTLVRRTRYPLLRIRATPI